MRIRLSNAKPMPVPGIKRKLQKQRSRKLPNGKQGDYTFTFQIRNERTGEYSNLEVLRFDTYEDAKEYAARNTPVNHQGLIDNVSVISR